MANQLVRIKINSSKVNIVDVSADGTLVVELVKVQPFDEEETAALERLLNSLNKVYGDESGLRSKDLADMVADRFTRAELEMMFADAKYEYQQFDGDWK